MILCQGQNVRGRGCRVIDRNYTPEQSNVLCRRGVLLSNNIKKTPADRQGHRSREQLVERPWLQLMCCVPVFGRKVVTYFGVEESCQTEVLRRQVKESADKTRLGPDNINLQTKEIHYNYSVLIGSPE